MAIGFHTGVLQDKTLDIARVHDQVMTDLLTHGLQKQEQREQEFVQMMSTDFINGLNNKAQEVQLKALREFNDLGTSIYKQRGKFGQIKLDDQIKIKKEKDRLQALQDNMRTTLQTFDQARATLAKDGGRNFDITETTSVINNAAKEWDGESTIGLDRLLVPAYVNLGDAWKAKVGMLDFQVEGTNIEKIEGDERVTYKKRYASGIKGEGDVVNYLRATAMDSNMRRSALKFITTDALEPDTRKRFEEVVKHYEDMGLKRANISDYGNTTAAQLGEAEVLAATSVQQGRFVEKDLMRQEIIKREKIERGVTSPGKTGQYTIVENKMHDRDGIEFTSATPRIQVESDKIGDAIFKGQNVEVNVRHVSWDGIVTGTYRPAVVGKETELPLEDKKYLNTSEVTTAEGAMKAYNKNQWAGKVIQVEKRGNEWIPIVQSDALKTITFPMDEVIEKRISSQAVNFTGAYNQKRIKEETANDDPLGLGI